MNKHLLSFVLGGTLMLSPVVARAQKTGPIGQIVSYQGRLLNANGTPIADGTTNVTFSFQEAGGAVLYSTTQSVATVGGVFNTFLAVSSFVFDPSKSYTLSVTFNGNTATHPIAAVPVATQAVNARTATNVSGIVAIAHGGTGSSTPNFVDLTSAQTVVGAKTFSDVLRGDGSFLMNGTTGTIPIEGAGTRMMWVPAKEAFRAGRVNGTQWDNANIGQGSMALGNNTSASGDNSIAMGSNTSARGNYSAAIGSIASASGTSSTALGYGATASGSYSTVLGYKSTASGDYSTALGSLASTNGKSGSFAYGDRSSDNLLNADLDNQAVWRVAGGFKIYSNSGLTAGVNLAAGSGSWSTLSDRGAKDQFGSIDSREVLRRVSALPLSSWQYKGNSSRHIGPMAQDFRAAFGLGPDEKHIDTVDADGVALAAIQGLNSELRDRDAKITALEAQNVAFEARLKQLETKKSQAKR